MYDKKPFEKSLLTERTVYCAWSNIQALVGVVITVALLYGVWFFIGAPTNAWQEIVPGNYRSIATIFYAHFFHYNSDHLFSNLVIFSPLGFLVFRIEGFRGVSGILFGMLTAGVIVWLFGDNAIAGFSSAVIACWGILLVICIQTNLIFTVVFLVAPYLFMEFSLLKDILPPPHTEQDYISSISHLLGLIGGLIGGMASQIRNLPAALGMLQRKNKVTKLEFITIKKRIEAKINAKEDSDEDPNEDLNENLNENLNKNLNNK